MNEKLLVAVLTAMSSDDFESVADILNQSSRSELQTLVLDLGGYFLAFTRTFEESHPSFSLHDMLREFGLDAARSET